jgi:hypothetical protein
MANKSFFNPKGSFAMGLAGAIGAWEPELMKYAFKDILTRKMYGKSLKDLTKEQLEMEQEKYLRDKALKEAGIKEKEAKAEYYRKKSEEIERPKEDPLEEARKKLLEAQTEWYKNRLKTGIDKNDFAIEKHIELKLFDDALNTVKRKFASPEEKNKAQNLIDRILRKYKLNISDFDKSTQNDMKDNIDFDLFKKNIIPGLKTSPLDLY